MTYEPLEPGLFVAGDLAPAQAFWDICQICTSAKANTNCSLDDMNRLFIPPILQKTYRIFYSSNTEDLDSRRPIAFCTWAWLNDLTAYNVCYHHVDPLPDEWDSGANLWIIDLVCKEIPVRIVARYLQSNY